MAFSRDLILDSILVLCEHEGKVISANYQSATKIDEQETTITKAQVAVIDAVMDLHRGNCTVENKGVLVLNPDDPIDKWMYDHDPDEPPNALVMTILSHEGRRFKCKTPLICKPKDKGVLFCKACASLDNGTFAQIVLPDEEE